MPQVVALYRYPVKGFTPEECDTLTVLDEGRIAGDRVLGVRFADTQAADKDWSRKTGMVALINTPGLARLRVRFDEKAFRLHITLGTSVLVDELLSSEGRRRIGEVLAGYVLKLDENPLTGHPERLPLRVIGDGIHRVITTKRQVGLHCTGGGVFKHFKPYLGTRSTSCAFVRI